MSAHDLVTVQRWNMKALELVRRIEARGLDPDTELALLQKRYESPDTERSLEIPRAPSSLPVARLKPLPTERPTATLSSAEIARLRKASAELEASRRVVMGVDVSKAPRGIR